MKYDHIIGSGGVGTGMVFSLEGNHLLGREESRMAQLETFKDFCKMHIILHYVAVLMQNETKFKTYPLGAVGDDHAGKELLQLMQNVGMEVQAMQVSNSKPTLLSICFQYPDFTGGNITSSNSASDSLTSQDIKSFFESNGNLQGGIVLAVPEVPLATRVSLLQHGRAKKYLNVASFQSGEMQAVLADNLLGIIDILAINEHEARLLIAQEQDLSMEEITKATQQFLLKNKFSTQLLITCGAKGSYFVDQKQIYHTPSHKVDQIVSTAGAGDAFLAGFIVGLVLDYPIIGSKSAIKLGTTLAAFSLQSSDTIHFGVDKNFIQNYFKA